MCTVIVRKNEHPNSQFSFCRGHPEPLQIVDKIIVDKVESCGTRKTKTLVVSLPHRKFL